MTTTADLDSTNTGNPFKGQSVEQLEATIASALEALTGFPVRADIGAVEFEAPSAVSVALGRPEWGVTFTVSAKAQAPASEVPLPF